MTQFKNTLVILADILKTNKSNITSFESGNHQVLSLRFDDSEINSKKIYNLYNSIKKDAENGILTTMDRLSRSSIDYDFVYDITDFANDMNHYINISVFFKNNQVTYINVDSTIDDVDYEASFQCPKVV